MDVLPNSLKILLAELRNKLVGEVLIVQYSSAIFQIKIPDVKVTVFFYISSKNNVNHLEHMAEGRVVHIDEDVFLLKTRIVLTRLWAALEKAERIYARNTLLVRINKAEALAFQQMHHLQVALPGKYRYGLFYKADLVAIAVFSGGRIMRNQPPEYRSFELLRFCHKSGFLVVGGLTKLIKGMVKQFNPGDIMTYVDRDWSDGKNYEQLGFRYLETAPPQKFYINAQTGIRYDTKAYQISQAEQRNDTTDTYYTVSNLGSIKMRYIV